MNKASPVALRKSIEMANALVQAGILFVPVPALSEKEKDDLLNEAMEKLDRIEKDCA